MWLPINGRFEMVRMTRALVTITLPKPNMSRQEQRVVARPTVWLVRVAIGHFADDLRVALGSRLQIIERFEAKLWQRRRPAWPEMDEVRFSPALSVDGPSSRASSCLLPPASTESSIRPDTRVDIPFYLCTWS